MLADALLLAAGVGVVEDDELVLALPHPAARATTAVAPAVMAMARFMTDFFRWNPDSAGRGAVGPPAR